MTKRTTRKPAVNLNRMSEKRLKEATRVLNIGGDETLRQQKEDRAILKAIMHNFDAMIEAVDDVTRQTIFATLLEVANLTDTKRIKMHQRFGEGEVTAIPPVEQQSKAQGVRHRPQE